MSKKKTSKQADGFKFKLGDLVKTAEKKKPIAASSADSCHTLGSLTCSPELTVIARAEYIAPKKYNYLVANRSPAGGYAEIWVDQADLEAA